MDNCEHIQPCTECGMSLCSYCIEDCDGCEMEACEKCYTNHMKQCKTCEALLCPKVLIGEQCPSCEIQNG